ncbi:MAG: hypothetical protein LBQ93_09625 [Treponema sp.]|jgi:hypothetical protein|nr:hypothetical protein [Treponema sp.]
MQHVYISDVDGKPAVCFDSGLDARSFARTKMSQSLIENGYIVRPDGSREIWKASGVNEVENQMRIWGPHFAGKRFDLLLNDLNSTTSQQTAFQAVVFWLRAKMLLGDTRTTLDPGAVFVCLEDDLPNDCAYPKGSVFFAPENLANRCLVVERTKYPAEPSGGTVPAMKRSSSSVKIPVLDRYNCPDLTGMEAVAFCAGTILYKILANAYPYPDDTTIFQDMREGVFLPPHLAIFSLDKKFCELIQLALLLPVEKRSSDMSGTDIISEMLRALMENESQAVSVSSLFIQLSPEESIRLEKEKKRHLIIHNVFIKIKRFTLLNKQIMIGTAVVFIFILFLVVSTTRSLFQRPTTEGMASDAVAVAYYEAFSSLDHVFMEACVQGAKKNDINAVMNILAIDKTRQAYQMSTRSTYIPAKEWKESGGEQPALDVFGITDLSIFHLNGREEDGLVMYRINYLLWSPEGYLINRSDVLTLKRDKRKNWRITDIVRVEELR